METRKTAEDFYHSQAEFNRWLKDLMPHEEDHLKSMLEEYGQLCAEQARREEREKHSKLLTWAKEQVAGMEYPGVTFEQALAAAGYGKEES